MRRNSLTQNTGVGPRVGLGSTPVLEEVVHGPRPAAVGGSPVLISGVDASKQEEGMGITEGENENKRVLGQIGRGPSSSKIQIKMCFERSVW